MFGASATTNMSQRMVEPLVQLPPPATFILSQLELELDIQKLLTDCIYSDLILKIFKVMGDLLINQ
jgi:hypothetical protein